MYAHTIAATLLAADDTIGTDGVRPEFGYAVGLAGGAVFETEPSVDELELWIVEHDGARTFGSWHGPDGRLYVDVIVIVPTFDEAMTIAQAQRQQAFYCLTDDTCHYVPAVSLTKRASMAKRPVPHSEFHAVRPDGTVVRCNGLTGELSRNDLQTLASLLTFSTITGYQYF